MPAFKVLKTAIIDLHEESLANTNEEKAEQHRVILNHLCATLDRMENTTYRNPAYSAPDLMKKLFAKLGENFPLTGIFENEMTKTFYDVENELKAMILQKTSTVMVERPSTGALSKSSVFAQKQVTVKAPILVNATDLSYDSDSLTSPFTP
jgi:hypothetical protein